MAFTFMDPHRRSRIGCANLLLLICVLVAVTAEHLFGRIDRIPEFTSTSTFHNRINAICVRGGALDCRDSGIDERVTQLETSRTNGSGEEGNDSEIHGNEKDDAGAADEDFSAASVSESVGIKQHVKKSNAVGDPDGEGSSDDEDDELFSDWEDDSSMLSSNDPAEMEDNLAFLADASESHDNVDDVVLERVQVEVEYTVEDDADDDDDVSTAETIVSSNNEKRSRIGGVVGVRGLGQRFKNRNRKIDSLDASCVSGDIDSKQEFDLLCQEAWKSHILLPPPPPSTNSSFWQYLQGHLRSIDADGKMRLDRRTLYAGLLTEWTATSSLNMKNSNFRKFIDPDTSQALQAALSLATQPLWRNSLQRPSAIRFYYDRNDGDSNQPASSSTTLAIQETVALALVRQ